MNKENILKGILLSLSAIIIGFLAITIPFKLFGELTSTQMTTLFVTEIIIYFSASMIYLVTRDIKAEKKQKQTVRTERKRAEIKQMQTEWLDLIA